MVHPKDYRGIVAYDRLARRDKRVGVVTLLPLIAALAGCGSEEAIRHYRVPSKDLVFEQNHVASAARERGMSPASAPVDQRMLGAIIPVGNQTWYFKMVGPDAAVAAVGDQFEQLIKSVSFADEKSTPEWTLPDGWKQQQGSGQRLATMVVESEGTPLELTVIPLTLPNTAEVMLANVNRWRDQLGLSPISADQLDSETNVVELAGATATLVDLVGKAPCVREWNGQLVAVVGSGYDSYAFSPSSTPLTVGTWLRMTATAFVPWSCRKTTNSCESP